MEKVTIRKAVKEDCKQVRSLIQELADYQKMSDNPTITAETLENDGFGEDRQYFQCVVAETESGLIGFSMYCFTYSWKGKQVYMEDLYVQPQYRAKGIGTKLWKAVVKHALDIGCARCDFSALDWNKPSIEFYKSKGAHDLSESGGYKSFRMEREVMENFVNN